MTPAKLDISLVVAAADNGVIGRDGKLPWRMPSDLKMFRKTTIGKPVIMGRVTFDSIGKPLPGRDNIVVSRYAGDLGTGVHVAGSVAEAIELAETFARARGVHEIAVIGGAQIYAAVMPEATRIYLTRIHAEPDGDTTFADPDPSHWKEVSRQPLVREPGDDHAATLVIYERRPG